MTTTTAVVPNKSMEIANDLSDLFSDIEPLDPLDIKKDELASNLAALMSYAQKTRSELARELGWEKSRVSKVLSGKDNLTVKTIWDFSSHLGFDFDVVFRGSNEPRPGQPWQKAPSTSLQLSTFEILSNGSQGGACRPLLDIQTAQQVVNDFLQGNHKSHYLSIDIEDRRTSMRTNSITIDAKPQTGVLTVLSTMASSIPVAIKESK